MDAKKTTIYLGFYQNRSWLADDDRLKFSSGLGTQMILLMEEMN